MSILSHPHPQWCDPRTCVTDRDGTDHRQAPITWTAGDHSFTVGLARLDHDGPGSGDDQVAVVVEDLETLTPSGDVARVTVYLSGADTQVFTAALGYAAAQLAAAAVPAVAR